MRHIRVHTGEKPFKVNAFWKKLFDNTLNNIAWQYVSFCAVYYLQQSIYAEKFVKNPYEATQGHSAAYM